MEKFKTGDKVVIARAGGPETTWNPETMNRYVNDGLVYEIGDSRNDAGDYMIQVHHNNDYGSREYWYFHESTLEFASDFEVSEIEKVQKFKVDGYEFSNKEEVMDHLVSQAVEHFQDQGYDTIETDLEKLIIKLKAIQAKCKTL